MAKKTVAAKKRNVKVDANGQLHVHSSFNNIIAVSYTHLDVYKRQVLCILIGGISNVKNRKITH